MLAERYTKTIIRSKAEERYQTSTVHARKEVTVQVVTLSSGAKILGQQAMNVASDMIDGKSFQDSAKSRLKKGIKTFVTSNPIIPQSGSAVRPEASSSAVHEAE